MRVLIIGGTGLISTGIVKHLHARGDAEITMLNRGQRENTLQVDGRGTSPATATTSRRSRSVSASERFDVVIDMICFTPQQAESDVRVVRRAVRAVHLLLDRLHVRRRDPAERLVDETFPQEPISEYGRNKLACERIFLDAHAARKFNATIIRPSCTYGPGGRLIDNLEFDPPTWDRIERGLPVLCSGDGLGLWVATHRDDCGKLFAYAAMNPKTYGQSYNATRDENFTWRDFYREAAAAIGQAGGRALHAGGLDHQARPGAVRAAARDHAVSTARTRRRRRSATCRSFDARSISAPARPRRWPT